MRLQLGNGSLSETRPYLNLSMQELLDHCQFAAFKKDELQKLRHELSFRNDRCKKAMTAMLNFAMKLNSILQNQSFAPKQPKPEYLTLEQAYVMLGLNEGCSIDEVRSAHSNLMKELHPNKTLNLPPRTRAFVENERTLIDCAMSMIDQCYVMNLIKNNNESETL